MSDEGEGIAPDNLPRIFEPFFTTRGVGGGLGLGLTAAWNIITAFQGRIDVQSALGRGTTVTVRLPRAPVVVEQTGLESPGGGCRDLPQAGQVREAGCGERGTRAALPRGMTRLGFFAAFLAGQALAFSVATDSQGDVVRWRLRAEFVLDQRFGAELGLPAGAAEAVEEAAAAYDAQTQALEVRVRRGAAGAPGYATEAGARNQSVIVALHDWQYSSLGLATTLVTVNARTNEILDADIAFNVDSYAFTLVGVMAAEERAYDVQNTIMHELGHALGLQHNAEDPAVVMYPSTTPQETVKRHLAPDDIAGLSELYAVDAFAHPEVVAGCAAAPGGLLPAWLALGGGLWLLARSRRPHRRRATGADSGRVAAVGLVALVGVAQASEPAGAGVTAPPDEVAWAEVVDTRSRWLPGAGVIVTDAEVEVRTCERGECPRGRVLVQVLGGRVGDIEQYVAHQPPVVRGARVLLVKQGGRRRLMPTTLGHTTRVAPPPGVKAR